MAHSLRPRSTVNRVDLVGALADVARALVRLHGAGHIHRDVKARNVLISADFRTAKLADFGLARPLLRPGREAEAREPAGGMTPRIGPRKYRAPEVEQGAPYGPPADMYSFGVMVRELLELLRRSRERCYTAATLDMLRALGHVCRRQQPEKRPSAMEALTLLQAHLGSPLPPRDGGSARHRLAAPRGALADRLRPRGERDRGGEDDVQPPPAVPVGGKRPRSRSRSGSKSDESSSGRLVRLAALPRKEWRRNSESSPSTSSAGAD
jgi:serine/threonine protein kinase